MPKKYLITTLGIAAAIFILVFSIHWNYHLPYHIDEWHNIGAALRMSNYGEYFSVLQQEGINRFSGIEIGFHLFLFLLSFVVNIVYAYQFFPAIWAALTALALFFVAYKKTGNNPWIGWLAMIFFASIKSNVNIIGLWFFTPLTFALPLIFLYFYFFSEGVEKRNNKYIAISFAIMLALIPIHSLSLLFALPTLLIYTLINYKWALRQPLVIASAAVIGIAGLVFYKMVVGLDWVLAMVNLILSLQFRFGWGVIEAKVPPGDIYPWIGYLMAVIGAIFIIKRGEVRKYLIFLLWPLTVALMIIIFMATGYSFFSPYQRNLYYFAIAMPLLSAIGFYYSFNWAFDVFSKLSMAFRNGQIGEDRPANHPNHLARYAAAQISVIVVMIMLFFNYYQLPDQFELYQAIDNDDAQILHYLAKRPNASVMAPPMFSSTVYPLTGMDPVGDLSFFGHPEDVFSFYLSDSCSEQLEIIAKHNVKYVIAPFEIGCSYAKLIMDNESNNLYSVE